MADYLSAFTGQEIDQKLAEVDKKINIADIVDNSSTGESDTPASSRLMSEAYKAIDEIKTFNSNKVLTIDKGDQTINGKKTFAALLALNGGAIVPAGKSVTLTDKASAETDAVNLAMLKDHGISLDDSISPGIALERLATGYIRIISDIRSMTETTDAVSFIPVATSAGTFKISYDNFISKLANSDTVKNKVEQSVYDAKMVQIDNALSARVLNSTYNLDLATTNLALGNRVLTSTYSAKMTQLDTSIAGKVDTTAYNTAISSLQTGKVDVSTYTAGLAAKVDVSTYNTAMANKVGYGNDGQITVGASTSGTVFTMAKPNMLHILATTALTDGLIDVYEIFMSNTTVISVTNKIKNSSGTSPATFTATVSGNNISLVAANAGGSTMTVKYKIIVNF